MRGYGAVRRKIDSLERRLPVVVAPKSEAEDKDSLPANYPDYLSISYPNYEYTASHFKLIFDALKAIEEKQIDRLAVFMPPRHGKSSTVTIPFPAYLLEKDPSKRILVAAHTMPLAEKFSRATRNLFSGRVGLSEEKKSAKEWETTAGGGMMARGIRNAPTGFGFNHLFIDDPIKNREEAESLQMRDKIWDSYSSDFFTRLEPKGSIVLCLTRWHYDDLAARALAAEPGRWYVITLPAFAEDNDQLGRKPGEALWPERYDREALLQIKSVLTRRHGSLAFESLYQQNPAPKDGAVFHPTKIRVTSKIPPYDQMTLCRGWDFAASDGKGSDWTVGALMGCDQAGNYYILDIVRDRSLTDDRDRKVKETAQNDPKGTKIFIPQDPGQAGKSQIVGFGHMLRGFTLVSETMTGSKTTRAEPFASQVNLGNVYVPDGAVWLTAMIDEMVRFPLGAHDDQIDALSCAFQVITQSGLGVYV